jgi:hypothetical protein
VSTDLLAGPTWQPTEVQDTSACAERTLAVVTTRGCGRDTGHGVLTGGSLVTRLGPTCSTRHEGDNATPKSGRDAWERGASRGSIRSPEGSRCSRSTVAPRRSASARECSTAA